MAEDQIQIHPETSGNRSSAKRRNGNFIDQVTKKRRLGQGLGVDERRGRLERNGCEPVEPVQAAR
jgi:hypothetical protein